ncbi:MAG: UTP--glucose-1-phosphate uridylyltransferase [Dehalococcoidia bacterium]|nr:UTP--glucose-1-phosphate uridylyltransferase [Dehalococcoidia bacterium]
MPNVIRKAVITAAGMGTRFLPATKSVQKEMLPLLDRPMIHYVVEEAVMCGIRDITVVTNAGKNSMQDYFSPSPALEKALSKKPELLEQVRAISKMAEFHFVQQTEQLGFGHAVLMAKDSIGNEPFALLLPDDIIDAEIPALKQLLNVYGKLGGSIVAVQRVPMERISAYGVIKPKKLSDKTYRVMSMTEKPSADKAPSDLGIVGRYILSPEVFRKLQVKQTGALGEIPLTDAINTLISQESVYACELTGTRFDVGNPLGLLKASVAFALKDKNISGEFREYIKSLLSKPKD